MGVHRREVLNALRGNSMYVGVPFNYQMILKLSEASISIHRTQMLVMACTIQPRGSGSKEERTLDTNR